ncbi:MAG TPA: ABC transporter permease [Mucilaginibacter sp.]|nr:ABC transporter permease [Mucilaginibacter sp.]
MRPYFFHISTYDLASAGLLFSGLTLALLLCFVKRPGKAANLFLSSASAAVALSAGGLTPILLPALGPSVYFYVRQQIQPEHRFVRKDLLHFCPLLAGYWVPVWLIVIWAIAYLYFSHRLIQNSYNKLHFVLMDRPRFAFRRLDRVLLALGLACVLWLINDAFCFAVAFILMAMAVKTMLTTDDGVAPATRVNDRSDAREKGRRLKEAVAANRLYEDPELTLATLAVKLNVHPHELSRIINIGLDKNFNDFINDCRVREVARKMHDPVYDRLTLLGIAYESGFNSKRTFNRVFKEITGRTPVEYKNSLKKEVPINKLAPLAGMRPVLLRQESPPNRALVNSNMIKSYFTISLRNLLKRKGYTALNILGLTIGITCCLLIFQYVSRERSYDTFQKDSRNIVRIRLDEYKQGKLLWQSATSYPAFGPLMKKDYPEVENYCRLIDDEMLLSNDARNVKFSEKKGYFADPSSIDMLGVDLVAGNNTTALDAPNKMVISQGMALKYFGTIDAVGKTLQSHGDGRAKPDVYQITGVFKDYPKNSHLIIDYLVSYETLRKALREQGDKDDSANTAIGWYDFYVYLQLRPGTNLQAFQAKMPAFADKYVNKRKGVKDGKFSGNKIFIIPLSDIHLYSNYNQEAEVNGSGSAVSFMFLIALIILGIAWINYINLSTARSVERAKEVGVRKVLGAGRQNLVGQFMLENVILNCTAIIIATGAVLLLTPVFNQLMGQQEVKQFSMTSKYWFIFAGIFISGTLLSGVYPAFVLSGYQPVAVLKGAFKNTSGGLILRKGLIILQFSISVILIAGTIIVYQQVNFMRKQKLGVNINQTLVLDGVQSVADSTYQDVFQPFKTELLKNPGIKSITASTNVMGQEIYWTNGFGSLDHKDVGGSTVYRLGIDYDFIPQFGMKLLAGRNFSKDFPSDKKAAILNDKTLVQMGFKDPQDAIGKKISNGRDTLTVIGVVQSFHQMGLQKPIDPQLITLLPNARNAYSIKLQTADLQGTIAAVKASWNKYFPNDPFNYFFLDDEFNAQYQSDQRFGEMFTLFSLLAILIACFGLVGLSAYNILQRTKEVGIRKVLGASVRNVVFILSKDFMILVIVSFVIATPAAWFIMHNWLQDYAFRIDIKWWVFGIAGVLAFIIAFGTLSFQAIKAALANPVKSLRTE